MPTAFENLKQRQASIAPESIKKVNAFDTLKQRKDLVVSKTSQPQPEEKKVKGGFLGELLTGSTQKFGKTAGEAIAAPKNAQLYADTLESHTKIQNDLIKTIKAKKSLGQDTSRLEQALAYHVKSTPKLEQFTGDVISKTTGQVIGEAGGTALEALSGGALGGGSEAVASKTLSTLGKVKEAAKIGAIYGGIGGTTNALQEGKDVTATIGGALTGTLVGGALGGGIGAIGAAVEKKLANRAANLTAKKENITGQILQGSADDIPKGQKVFSKIDTTGVKSYDELGGKLEKKVEQLSNKQDKVLNMDLSRRKLGSLNATMKSGESEIKYNYVKDALDQLKDYYAKTNNQVRKFEIEQLEKKAAEQGLTNKEINDIAKLHGRELSAFNVNGQLASGLSKQAAENTRAGVKSTVRELSGDKTSKAIDQEIARTIRVKDLVQKQSEKVNELQQKIQEYGLGEKFGRKVFQIANFFTGGGLKGAVAASLPRGTGYKTLNALDLEQTLQKNLKLLNELSEKEIPKNTFIQRLDAFLNQSYLDSHSSKLGNSQANTQKIPLRIQRPRMIDKKTSINRLPVKPPKLGK